MVGNEWREKKMTKIYQKINGEPNVKRGSHKNIPFIRKCARVPTNTQAWSIPVGGLERSLKGRRGLGGVLFVLAPAPSTGGS